MPPYPISSSGYGPSKMIWRGIDGSQSPEGGDLGSLDTLVGNSHHSAISLSLELARNGAIGVAGVTQIVASSSAFVALTGRTGLTVVSRVIGGRRFIVGRRSIGVTVNFRERIQR